MLDAQCMICKDVLKFRRKLNEARMIAQLIEKKLCKFNKEDIKLLNKENIRDRNVLKLRVGYFHSMCEGCHKIQKTELKRTEKEVVDLVVTLKLIAQKENDSGILYEVYKTLCGRFPDLANYILK